MVVVVVGGNVLLSAPGGTAWSPPKAAMRQLTIFWFIDKRDGCQGSHTEDMDSSKGLLFPHFIGRTLRLEIGVRGSDVTCTWTHC